MRPRTAANVLSLLAATALAACGPAATGGANPSPSGASAATTPPTVAPTAAATPYPPKAEGFATTVLLERKRNIGASFLGYVRVMAGGMADADAIQAKVASGESFAASYRAVSTRTDAGGQGLYESTDLAPLSAGIYTEGLREAVIQPGGRSAAHKHAGYEVVLVLEGTVLVRSALAAPFTVTKGQGFTYSVSNSPIQIINVGGTVARNLVYSLTAEGLPFPQEIDQAP